MKKLMVGIFTVALAATTQAALYLQVRTGSPDAPTLSSSTMSGYSCYFVTLDSLKGDSFMKDSTLKITDVSKVTSYFQKNFDSAWSTVTTGKKGLKGANAYWNNQAMNTYTSNDAYLGNAFAFLAYESNKEVTNFRVVSLNGAKSGTFRDWEEGTAIWGEWTATSVPEPTSGLLMLLGVAGLALKRKRA